MLNRPSAQPTTEKSLFFLHKIFYFTERNNVEANVDIVSHFDHGRRVKITFQFKAKKT